MHAALHASTFPHPAAKYVDDQVVTFQIGTKSDYFDIFQVTELIKIW